jgi:pimeloyl-ACP methyl ester carboxylesterase
LSPGSAPRAGEYVVPALRTLSRQAGQRVDVVGWSQGGMVGRWALRFRPDTRARVENLIGLSPSDHGTAVADTRLEEVVVPDAGPRPSAALTTGAGRSPTSPPRTSARPTPRATSASAATTRSATRSRSTR